VLVTTVFEHEVSVRWRDVDGLGHVNHAVFLTYLEEGRDAFYVQALGRDPHYVVARVEIDMRAEIRYTDRRLQVRIEVERVGTTSLTTRETILTPAGASAADARVVTVLWDAGAREPMAFAPDERTRLAAYRSSEPGIRNALYRGLGRLPRWRPSFLVSGGLADCPVQSVRCTWVDVSRCCAGRSAREGHRQPGGCRRGQSR
jgi:acyl-CoA thioester hydrolase